MKDIEMIREFTGEYDTSPNKKPIYLGDFVATQIDGRLPNVYKGQIEFRHGCFGMAIDGGFEPMIYFINTVVISSDELP